MMGRSWLAIATLALAYRSRLTTCNSLMNVEVPSALCEYYRQTLICLGVDGLVLSKLINDSVPDTIDERVLNKASSPAKGAAHRRGPSLGATPTVASTLPKGLNAFQMTENNNIVIASAKGIGCSVVNIGPTDLSEGREHLILGLIWQIIRRGLLSKIDIKIHPELYRLLEDDETIEQFLRLPPDQILLRWFNYHLKAANWQRRFIQRLFSSRRRADAHAGQSRQLFERCVGRRKLYRLAQPAQTG